MTPPYFNAVLKTDKDLFLEVGTACVYVESESVDFKNEFVPLMKLGETAKVVRTDGSDETQSFVGKVYLSSRKLLRIVSVKDYILPNAAKHLSVTVPIQAVVTPVTLLTRKHKTAYAILHFLSMHTIKFTCREKFEPGQKLLITIPSSTPGGAAMRDISVSVYKNIIFGENETGYHCTVLDIPAPCVPMLRTYLELENVLFRRGASFQTRNKVK